MKIIVLGGSGFIGSHVVDALSRKGHKVTIFDKKKSKWLRRDQKMIVGDIFNDFSFLSRITGIAPISDSAKENSEPIKPLPPNTTIFIKL